MNSTVKFLVNVTVLTAAAGSVAMAQTAGMNSLRNELANRPTLEVRVYDYARLDHKSLQAAESESDRIFSLAGINIRWVDCPTSHEVAHAFPACIAPASGASDTLILLTGMAPTGSKADDVLGQAGEHNGRRITVFYGRIVNLAGGDTAPANALMGRVITHFLGRELLGDARYAKAGIMQDIWGDEQLNEIAGTQVLFTPDQSRRIVSRLNEENQTLGASQGSLKANGQ